MVPPCSDRISRVPPYSRARRSGFPYGALTLCGRPFQSRSGSSSQAAGLVRVRSPLLAESRLMSFPPATEMFQFAGFASHRYGFPARSRDCGGLPHSEISGSKLARSSPKLIAACYVLHRLSVPRHPPNALFTLVSRNRRAQRAARSCARPARPRRHASYPDPGHPLPCIGTGTPGD